MCETVSWCKFSFSAFISKLLQTYFPVLSPQWSCQELKWRLMYIENFHYHAKPIISFHPLTTASLWYSDQKSTQSTRKQVAKIITFVKQHEFKQASSSSLVVLSAVPLSALCNFPFSRTIIGCMRSERWQKQQLLQAVSFLHFDLPTQPGSRPFQRTLLARRWYGKGS